MGFKKINISLGGKLLSAFGASLLIVISIGLIGIFQIQFLAAKVDILGKHYLPMQSATQELKVSNNLYVMGIKNYAFWESSRYLEAARAAADLDSARQAKEKFQKQLNLYEKHLTGLEKEAAIEENWINQQRKEIEEISAYASQLRHFGSEIIELTQKRAGLAEINMAIMSLDSELYRINDFIGETLQKEITHSAQKQLFIAEQAEQQAVTFLGWSLALGVLIGGQTAWLVSKNLKRELTRRREIIAKMIHTEERERQHLSAQVHDQMSQDLGALKIYLGLIQQESDTGSGEFKEKLSQTKKIVTSLLDKSHNISLLLRPPSLDEVGLVGSLEALVQDYQRLSPAEINFIAPQKELKVSPEHSLYFYRFVQEALTNAAKYAAASNIEIKLRVLEKEVELVYQDDGRGFNYQEVIRQPRRRLDDKARLGLLSLQERAELLGGSMQVETAPGKGTRIAVRLNC